MMDAINLYIYTQRLEVTFGMEVLVYKAQPINLRGNYRYGVSMFSTAKFQLGKFQAESKRSTKQLFYCFGR